MRRGRGLKWRKQSVSIGRLWRHRSGIAITPRHRISNNSARAGETPAASIASIMAASRWRIWRRNSIAALALMARMRAAEKSCVAWRMHRHP